MHKFPIARMIGNFALMALCAACASEPLRIYSPAAGDPMLAYNANVVEVLNACSPDLQAEILPVALPDSINQFADISPDKRAVHWPIVTIVDFLPAVRKTGPSWHAYDRKNDDLVMLSALYDVGFGLMAFDPSIRTVADLRGKRIAVPRRPSSLRVIVEAQLRDGWDILDHVVLVEMPPNQVVSAVEKGEIDATFWNAVMQERGGFSPMFPSLADTGHWLSVDDEALAAINEANGFGVSTVLIENAKGPRLLSLRQGLAAWRSVDPSTVNTVLECLADHAGSARGLPASLEDMRYWPGATEDLFHPAAQAFYDQH